jgi:F0F1-type ATP synthase alpha subunit
VIEEVANFESNLFDYLDANASVQLKAISETGDLSDEQSKDLEKVITDFKNSFVS